MVGRGWEKGIRGGAGGVRWGEARRTAVVIPSPAAVWGIWAKRCTSCGKAMLATAPALEETCPTVHPQPYARLRMESKS
mgnify:CR=1 FL=1